MTTDIIERLFAEVDAEWPGAVPPMDHLQIAYATSIAQKALAITICPEGDRRCERCEARDRDWWKPDPEDPFWMLEAEDGEWLKNADSLLGTRDPSKAMRFPTKQDAANHPACMKTGSKWWTAKPTDHQWIARGDLEKARAALTAKLSTEGECSKCEGRGEVWVQAPGLPRSPNPEQCGACNGTGLTVKLNSEALVEALEIAKRDLKALANWRKDSTAYTDKMDQPRRKMDEAQVIHMESEAERSLREIDAALAERGERRG